jgi:hypothetical protein
MSELVRRSSLNNRWLSNAIMSVEDLQLLDINHLTNPFVMTALSSYETAAIRAEPTATVGAPKTVHHNGWQTRCTSEAYRRNSG